MRLRDDCNNGKNESIHYRNFLSVSYWRNKTGVTLNLLHSPIYVPRQVYPKEFQHCSFQILSKIHYQVYKSAPADHIYAEAYK